MSSGRGPGARSRRAAPVAERLLSRGYIEIDRKGLFAGDAYVSATEIERGGDTVRLNVPKGLPLAKRT